MFPEKNVNPQLSSLVCKIANTVIQNQNQNTLNFPLGSIKDSDSDSEFRGNSITFPPAALFASRLLT